MIYLSTESLRRHHLVSRQTSLCNAHSQLNPRHYSWQREVNPCGSYGETLGREGLAIGTELSCEGHCLGSALLRADRAALMIYHHDLSARQPEEDVNHTVPLPASNAGRGDRNSLCQVALGYRASTQALMRCLKEWPTACESTKTRLASVGLVRQGSSS